MSGLNKEMMASVDNYGDRIKTLKDFVTAVRKRPGMYLGPIGNEGLLNMIREIFQNSVDQLLDPDSPCNWFSVYYNEQTCEVVVKDNGLGFPFNDIIRMLTTQHTSKNFEKKLYQYSSGMNGVGSKVVNALSDIFEVESYKYDGKAVKVTFEKGYPVSDKPKSIPNKDKLQGSKVSFIPDLDILGNVNLEWKVVFKLIKQIMSITPIGSRMTFEAVDINGKKFSEEIVNKDGIITDLIMKVKRPIIKPIVLGFDDGTHKLEAAICYDSGDPNNGGPLENEAITSFCNFCPTTKGTHIDGVLDGICRWFTQYMNNIVLVNQKSKNKLKVISADIKYGLNIMISAAHLEPIFTGQAKEILSNKDMVGFCKEVIIKGLDDWSRNNPQDLSKLSKFFKDIAELRQKSDKEKQKITQKYNSNPLSGLPSKYTRPLGKDNIELIIVEGDSAKGTVETGRNRQCQGIFPIRGKIINAFKASKEKFFKNEEVQAITRIILGPGGYRKEFKVEDCLVDKVIFMADADIDGAHISALLLRMFVMYFPQMIEAGMVYKAIPPLYSITKDKKNRYFTEQVDIVRYIQKIFLQNNQMCFLDGKSLSNKDITLFFMRNMDYIYYMDEVANTYSVDVYLLELVLNHYVMNNYSIKISKLQKEIKSVYRFMNVEKVKDLIVVKGTIDKHNLIVFNNKFLTDCANILRIISDNEFLYYLINSEKMSIYNILNIYNSCQPKNINRFKGLGEMDKQELAESTLYPGSDRTLVRYTLKDVKEEIEAIREYESNTKKILDLVGTISRDDLLD